MLHRREKRFALDRLAVQPKSGSLIGGCGKGFFASPTHNAPIHGGVKLIHVALGLLLQVARLVMRKITIGPVALHFLIEFQPSRDTGAYLEPRQGHSQGLVRYGAGLACGTNQRAGIKHQAGLTKLLARAVHASIASTATRKASSRLVGMRMTTKSWLWHRCARLTCWSAAMTIYWCCIHGVKSQLCDPPTSCRASTRQGRRRTIPANRPRNDQPRRPGRWRCRCMQ